MNLRILEEKIMGCKKTPTKKIEQFNPEGAGYDYKSAIAAGMSPDKGQHWGSVAPVEAGNAAILGLPNRTGRHSVGPVELGGYDVGTFKMLKGQRHDTALKTKISERQRGATLMKIADRYYSIPKGY